MTEQPIAIDQSAQRAASLVERTANRFGVEPSRLLSTLKSTAFRQPPKNVRNPDGKWEKVTIEVSNEQMMALLIVAEEHNLNPFTREIYAFPDKNNGIVPIVGVDGWIRKINEHPEFNGIEFQVPPEETWITPPGGMVRAMPEYTCLIHRKDREHPIVVTEYLDECYRAPFESRNGPINGPWQTHTKRFMRHRSLIQCSRVAFGFAGIHSPDEAIEIINGTAEREEAMAPRVSAVVSDLNERAGVATAIEHQEPQTLEQTLGGEPEAVPVDETPADEASGAAEQAAPAPPDTAPETASQKDEDLAAPTVDSVIEELAAATTPDDLDDIIDWANDLPTKERNQQKVNKAINDATARIHAPTPD